jgi:hypothetical protein
MNNENMHTEALSSYFKVFIKTFRACSRKHSASSLLLSIISEANDTGQLPSDRSRISSRLRLHMQEEINRSTYDQNQSHE